MAEGGHDMANFWHHCDVQRQAALPRWFVLRGVVACCGLEGGCVVVA